MTNQPSIFNDIIGPVMRGPSSSHTAASWRIAKTALQFLSGELKSAIIEFDEDGAWAKNFREQGTVLGMTGGLADLEISDSSFKDGELKTDNSGIKIKYQISSFENKHPNSMKMMLSGSAGENIEILAVSLGGGSFEIQKINKFNLSIKGDCYELLIWSNSNIEKKIKDIISDDVYLTVHSENNQYLINIKNNLPFNNRLITQIQTFKDVQHLKVVLPVMPIISGKQNMPSFFDIDDVVNYGKKENVSIGKLGLLYEKYRSGHNEKELMTKMYDVVHVIENSIKTGLEGTEYEDRIYPQQAHLIDDHENRGGIITDTLTNDIIKNVTAIMESKSALELIVANPTAGSCGTVGGVLTAVTKSLGNSDDEKLMAYFASGLIGIYISNGPGFSAEEHGCQVECGAASAMAAAGIVQLYGGTVDQAFGAASLALQNMIGLVCDPIADRVEAPCLGKNVNAAVNALASATMVTSGYRHLIPFKQVLETVERVSADMPSSVKCTGTGGLSVTLAAKEIKEKLKRNKL